MSTDSSSADAVRLIGDIGGTNARFALLRGSCGPMLSAHTLATADFADLGAAVQAYLARVGQPAPLEAAIAIANPVEGDQLRMTNSRWVFSIEATRQQLGLRRLVMLNDWEAMALAAPALSGDDLEPIGAGVAVDTAPRALIGPGTGLGVSALVRSREGEWVPIAGEGGHVTLAPGCEREADILRMLWREYRHVSAERLVSGMGLVNLYQAIARLGARPEEPLTPAEICERGLAASDAACEEALARFCSWLGNVAGNLALTLGARGGVYIGGGIVPRLGDYFARSGFREAFEAKGRFHDYLARIPTYVIRAPQPALVGAAMALGVHPA